MQEENIVSRPLALTYQDYQDNQKSLQGLTIDEYVVSKVLGSGQFGTVYLAQNSRKLKFALKLLDLREIRAEIQPKVKAIRQRLAQSEPKLMMLCQSMNLIKCYDIYENKDLKVLVMQFCDGQTLDQYARKKKKIPQRQVVQIIRQLINGIAQLHKHQIVHRDLKTENIMEHHGQYKIIDFGFSKKLQLKHESEQTKNTLLGTPTTMAPEVFLRKNYGLKADIWSIGIIFFQLVFGIEPYDSSNARTFYTQIQKKFQKGKAVTFNGVTLSNEAQDFLSKVLRVDTDERLDWRQMINHPLIKVRQEEPIPQRFVQRPSLIEPNVDIRLEEQTMMPSQYFIAEPQVKQKEDTPLVLSPKKDEQKKKENPSVEKPKKKVDLTQLIKEQNEVKKMLQSKQIAAELKKREERFKTIKQEEERNKTVSFHQCLRMHLDCLKTQLVFNEIFTPIQRHNLLNTQERSCLQFMHLLLSRCFKNMSPLKQQLRKNRKNLHRAFISLDEQIQNMYKKVKSKFDSYDGNLRKKQSSVMQVGKDFFSKIIWKEQNQDKNKFIGGIQRMPQRQFGDYTVQQQIDYTSEMILKMLPKMLDMGDISSRIKTYLKNYNKMMSVTLQDLGELTFAEYVRRLVN